MLTSQRWRHRRPKPEPKPEPKAKPKGRPKADT